MQSSPQKISAFVISYNRAAILATCLKALRFADELIVVDKSSTDDTPAIAARFADRVITVPWSPTADDTRAFALSQCTHDWIVFADDDECFSPEAIQFIQTELAAPRADIYEFALRHYILGVHDEHAYYWPEYHTRFIRRGAVEFSSRIHVCILPQSDRVLRVAMDNGACIHHLSHQDVTQWIEKANRYTSCIDRARVDAANSDLIEFAHHRIDHWLGRSPDTAPDGYPAAVALLRAVYDMIDRVKIWEEQRNLDGAALFRETCRRLDAGEAFVTAENRDLPRSQTHYYVRAETVDALKRTIHETDAALAAANARLDETSTVLAATSAELTDRSARLDAVGWQLERLAGSARVFARQYMPRLRRHLVRRLTGRGA